MGPKSASTDVTAALVASTSVRSTAYATAEPPASVISVTVRQCHGFIAVEDGDMCPFFRQHRGYRFPDVGRTTGNDRHPAAQPKVHRTALHFRNLFRI